jgi:hypothetical protein
MKTTAKNTKQIKNTFNTLAQELGCKARICGNARNIELQMWTGSVTSDGYEIVVKIDAVKFGQLISKYPQLQD